MAASTPMCSPERASIEGTGASCGGSIRSVQDWRRLIATSSLALVVLHGSASALGSDRGQAGIPVALLVTGSLVLVARGSLSPTLGSAARTLGLGRPRLTGLSAAAIVCLLLVGLFAFLAWHLGVPWGVDPQGAALLPGLLAQAGIAEELVFRGLVFGSLRRGRSFSRAAALSMLPFAAAHAPLLATLPLPVALAALMLSVVMSFSMSQLFELGGRTIWPSVLLHLVVQGVPKVVIVPERASMAFALSWMAACAGVPLLVFMMTRPRTGERAELPEEAVDESDPTPIVHPQWSPSAVR